MAKVIRDGLWLCTDCMILEETGDASSLDYHYGQDADKRHQECQEGLAELRGGNHLAADWDSDTGEGIEDFSRRCCDACQTNLAGERHQYCILA